MTLHCVYRDSPTVRAGLGAQLADADEVLLLGSAIYVPWAAPDWLETLAGVKVYVLQEDLQASGLGSTDDRVIVTDYAGWLALAEAHPTQRLWR